MKIFKNGKIITENQILEGYHLVFDERIVDITKNIAQYQGAEIIDMDGKYISPGLIDIHIHGAGGSDTMDGEKDGLIQISKEIVKCGVTSFLPTTMAMDQEAIFKSLEVVKNAVGDKDFCGARALGVHLEGPFINDACKGAQNTRYIQKPNMDLIKEYLDIIKVLTYAPEEDDDLKFTKAILNHTDIVLSIGHSNCDFETALKVYDMGVRHITHCFNGMKPMHHRNPGIVGAAMARDFYTEFIADGIHSNLELLIAFIKNRGIETSILITDSMMAGCLSPGEYMLGGQKVYVDDDSARLKDGTLAGSILRMDQAVRNVISAKIGLVDAVKMASLNPAKSIGMDDKKGSIKIGKDSDFVIFDATMQIKSVYIEAVEVYSESN